MSRVLALPALLVVVLVGGYLYTQDMRSNGPTSASGQQAIAQAQSAVAATNFSQAATAMQAFYVQKLTYAGATLPPGTGVVLVRADATSYCLAGRRRARGRPGRAAAARRLLAPVYQATVGWARRQSGERWYAIVAAFQLPLRARKRASSSRPRAVGRRPLGPRSS